MTKKIHKNQSENHQVPWKKYLKVTAETFFSFYIATFCLVWVLVHRTEGWITTAILLSIIYLFVLFACIRILIKNLSLPALMIITPIAPLLALISVISFIPLMEYLT